MVYMFKTQHQATKYPSEASSDRALGGKAPAELPPVEPLTCEQWAPCSCGHFEQLDDSGCGTCSSCGAAIESQLPVAVQAWVQASASLVQPHGLEWLPLLSRGVLQLAVLQKPAVLDMCSVICAASGVLRHTAWQGKFQLDATGGPAVASTLVPPAYYLMLVAQCRNVDLTPTRDVCIPSSGPLPRRTAVGSAAC